MTDTELILGVAGIGGTVLAGLSANLTTYVIDRRRRRREDDAAWRRLRRALRLVRSDLDGAAMIFEAVTERGEWWPDAESLTEGYLDAYREQLAEELVSTGVWVKVRTAEFAINRVVMVLAQFRLDHLGASPPVAGPAVDLLDSAAGHCRAAADALLKTEARLLRRRVGLRSRLAVGLLGGHARDTPSLPPPETPDQH